MTHNVNEMSEILSGLGGDKEELQQLLDNELLASRFAAEDPACLPLISPRKTRRRAAQGMFFNHEILFSLVG